MLKALLADPARFKPLILMGGFVGLLLLGVLLLIVLFKRRNKGSSPATVSPSGYAMAKALETVLRGKSSAEALGHTVYDALRFGNFSAYQGAFINHAEIDKFFTNDEAHNIKQQVVEMQQRQAFEKMHALFVDRQGELVNVRFAEEKLIYDVANKPVATLVPTAWLRLQQSAGTTELDIGAMIKLPVGWKLLLPPSYSAADDKAVH